MLTKEHKALFNMVRGWGGSVVGLGNADFRTRVIDKNLECPFDSRCGIDWSIKTFYYNTSKIPGIGTCIHETSHIFASKKEPWNAEEISFFAWEYTLANQLGVLEDWEKSSRDYELGFLSNYGIVEDGLAFSYSYVMDHKSIKTEFWHKLCLKADQAGLIKNGKVVPIR